MATKITTDMIKQINELYIQHKTYAAVARELGIAPTTVKKYVVKDYCPLEERVIKKFNIIYDLPAQYSIKEFEDVENFGDLCYYSEKESEEIIELWGELSI
jgi:predicted transcriptional regulator